MSRRVSTKAMKNNNASNPIHRPVSRGLSFARIFSTSEKDPMDCVEWEKRSAVIRSASDQVIFELRGIEVPSSWSDMALNVVASRYLRGRPGSDERETSIRNLIIRVAGTIYGWGVEQGYFETHDDGKVFYDELVTLLLSQKASFNSPVWFNVGVDLVPQCSACFILGVDDTMESILQWYAQEGLIFKGGSGSGVNLSMLRSRSEPLAGGGTASGPVSFMKAADASAGVIKSGGKTRRAAKMVILDVIHPDILEFVRCKAHEEKKAQALIREGYEGSWEGEAYSTVAFQNSNHSVRIPDEFMLAYEKDGEWKTRFLLTGETADTYHAPDLLREIAVAAHRCGDPGIQFHTTINRMNTCPNTAPIRGSNPCSEYFHVDDSACNLASLRLTGFLNDKNEFSVQEFRQAVDIMITAQDIIVDKASYPSTAIGENSKKLRAVGLGYADLGALIMSLGVPYDSDAGRVWASAISSIMTGEAYLQSARIARNRGPFSEYWLNRDAMMEVLRTQRESTLKIGEWHLPEDMIPQTLSIWDDALLRGEKDGFANCQVTVIAPTGTVGFMMDCDTTGIEPEMALVKHKTLAGGGSLKIVNRTVSLALRNLGYEPAEVNTIVSQIEEQGTIEGIPGVSAEHVPIFDCAFRPAHGNRFISPLGHIKMMSAVQPFISGGISKTVNLPADTSVEQIEEIFYAAWRMGLKSVSVYRDGCKSSQPVTLSSSESQEFPGPIRRRLPVDCKSVRHKFEIGGQKGYIHTGFYEDGHIGEIFIRMAKEGSTISGLMDTIATLTSIALQYGVPLEALVNKFSHVRFEPSGFTSNPMVPFAKSLTDYIFRYLGTGFLNREQQEAAGLLALPEQGPVQSSGASDTSLSSRLGQEMGHVYKFQSDAPACQECGAIMVRNGSCYKCLNCGATSGCS